MATSSSPALGRLHAFLETFNTGDLSRYSSFIAEHYVKGQDPLGFISWVYGEAGPLELVRIDEVTETVANATARTQAGGWMALGVTVEAEAPHAMTGFMPDFTYRPFDLAPGTPASDQEVAEELARYVDGLASREQFAGAVLVGRGGRVLYQAACGHAYRAYNVPNTIETRFSLGSMNKMFTAVAVAQLAQRGLLSFEDPVARHLPNYPREAAEKVTIHHLLTHTGGLGAYWNDAWEKNKNRVREVADYLPLFQEEPLRFEPGQGWFYSNAGFILLGAVIEQLSGMNYFDYVREYIYRPASMTETDSFALDEDPPRIAVGYGHFDAKGGVHPDRWFNNTFLQVPRGGPAGGGYATVRDMFRFAQALTDGTLLDAHHAELITTGKVKTDMGPQDYYGYGFAETRLPAGRTYGHAGGFPGVDAHLDIYPEQEAVAVVLSNHDFPSGKRVRDRALELITQGR